MKVHDATAGFVCYTRKVLETINLDKIRFKGYAFQIEMKFTASTLKFRLQEVPIIFTDRTLGTSKMSKGIIKEAVFGVITMKMLIQGGTIINEGRQFQADLVIEGGKITQILAQAPETLLQEAQVIDASHCFVIPGVIDDQVHFREP